MAHKTGTGPRGPFLEDVHTYHSIRHKFDISLIPTEHDTLKRQKHFRLSIRPEYAHAVRHAFSTAVWLKNERVWFIPWTVGETVKDHSNLLEMTIDNLLAAQQNTGAHNVPPSKLAAAASTSSASSSRALPASRKTDRDSGNTSTRGQPPSKIPAKAQQNSYGSPHPVRGSTAANVFEDDTEVEDMDYELRPIQDECREYAAEQFKTYMAYPGTVLDVLHVTKRQFAKGRVACVCIYGKVHEVITYYEMCFANSNAAVASFAIMHSHEDKHHDRAVYVIAAYI